MIRVLIVDDSAFVRKILKNELLKYDDIEVIGEAADPYAAREIIAENKPDVITLDIEMPRMDGITFLEKLMKYYPIPVIIVSSVTAQNRELILKAMNLGAIEVINKTGSQYSLPDTIRLIKAIKNASLINIEKMNYTAEVNHDSNIIKAQKTDLHYKSDNYQASIQNVPALQTTDKLIAIGASTGGTKALEIVLAGLPPDVPAVLVVQHMPEGFTESFARRLDSICCLRVKEAADGDYLVSGTVFIAPGNKHMVLARSGARYYIKIKDGPHVHHQKPSVDVLFHSVARNAGPNAVGVILTGMGADGASGMLEMHDSGSYNIAQDEQSSVVFGMPKEAIKLGAADEITALDKIAGKIVKAVEKIKH